MLVRTVHRTPLQHACQPHTREAQAVGVRDAGGTMTLCVCREPGAALCVVLTVCWRASIAGPRQPKRVTLLQLRVLCWCLCQCGAGCAWQREVQLCRLRAYWTSLRSLQPAKNMRLDRIITTFRAGVAMFVDQAVMIR